MGDMNMTGEVFDGLRKWYPKLNTRIDLAEMHFLMMTSEGVEPPDNWWVGDRFTPYERLAADNDSKNPWPFNSHDWHLFNLGVEVDVVGHVEGNMVIDAKGAHAEFIKYDEETFVVPHHDVVDCFTCGPTVTEKHPNRDGVIRCSNCKEWL